MRVVVAIFLKVIIFCSISVANDDVAISITSLMRTQNRVLGNVEVSILSDSSILISKKDVLVVLSEVMNDDDIKLLGSLGNSEFLSEEDFNGLGYPVKLDMRTFDTVINMPIDSTRVNSLSLEKATTSRKYIEPSIVSGYINTYWGGSRTESLDDVSGDTESYDQNHRLESGLNVAGLLLEYEGEYQNLSDEDGQYTRTGTRLLYDFPSQATRLSIGDINPNSGDFQGRSEVGGISLSRNFDDIPTRNVKSTGSQQFTLQRTSDVDVVVGGIVVQRLTLPAGRYDLSDIPLAQGSNDINLIIRDQAGNEEVLSFSIAIDGELLKQGEFEYVISAGAVSRYQGDKLEYQTDRVLLNSLIDVGITPSWTSSIDFQYLDNNTQVGLKQLNAWRYGVTELNLSYSHHDDVDDGFATRLSYSSPVELYDETGIRVDARYEYFSPWFSRVTDLVDIPSNNALQSIQHYAQVTSSFPIAYSVRGGFNASYSHRYTESIGLWAAGASLSTPIFNTRANFGVNVNYRENVNRDDDIDTSITLSLPLGSYHRVSSRYQSSNDLYRLDYSYRKGTGSVGGTAVNASIENSESTDLSLNGNVDYTANRFELYLDHNTRVEALTSDLNRVDKTRAEISTSLAFAGSEVSVGRVVGEAFAIVTPHSNLSDNRVFIDPDSNGQPRVETSGGSNVLLPDLVAYSPQVIDYDVNDLPPGYNLGAGVFPVNPMPGRGYVFSIGSDAVITLLGSLIDKLTNEPIALTAGYAYRKERDDERIEFFTNRKGSFAVMGMSEGRWVIELNTSPARRVEVDVKENETLLVRKGKIYVD